MLRRKPTVVELCGEDKAEYEAVKEANDAATAKQSQAEAKLAAAAQKNMQGAAGFRAASTPSAQPSRT